MFFCAILLYIFTRQFCYLTLLHTREAASPMCLMKNCSENLSKILTESMPTDYCSVAIMKKFVQLMLYFHWLRSPWGKVDILLYSMSRRMMVALFVNIGVAIKPLQSDIVFPYIQIFPIRLSWEFKQFNFSLVKISGQ